ncbi:WD domain, G-beta repeat domain containing protein [Plasmodium gonderi]|uniref:Arp2/3 complex 41 kDa subunit n=1 Tax=Plasmodium gonderi TaxID=77519 RepID=A0A1Y1JEM2_PLAGO|nr:WD domain, G-beta repeat domain containing protein [Plasmodium gonderi]GAW80956.1 WD domain, G-beta repeat domain containing protein [Plasmodium gonderi]
MIDYLKCDCIKYAIPDENSEPPISISRNKENTLVAAVENKKYVHIYKIKNSGFSRCDTICIGNRNKIIALEWSNQNDLLILTIDMKCVIYKNGKNGKWENSHVNIPNEDLTPTCVSWHPHSYYFAIGFSSGVILICSKSENQKWTIEKLINHSGSILFLQWCYSGHVLCSCSMDSTVVLVCTSDLLHDGPKNEEKFRTYSNIDKVIADRNLNNNDVISKIECEGHIIFHSSFSSSNERIAVITSNFENSCENQQIIISDYFESPPNTQFLSWIGQTMQKCLFLDENRLLVYGYEIFPILIESINGEWTISKVVLPQFSIKNLSVDFFYDKKTIQDIEEECKYMNGNEIIGEIVAHSNNILQISMLEPHESGKYITFVTVSSDFNVVFWCLAL